MALNRDPHQAGERFNRLLAPDYPLCRDDVIWMLEYVKKKVADEASELSNLPQPRLLHIFQSFAEASMIMIKQRSGGGGPETDRLRSCLREASLALKTYTPD